MICWFLGCIPLAVLYRLAKRTERLILWRTIGLAILMVIGLWSYYFQKIGVAFMPALDEGTALDMPSTIPRASVTQSSDDLKARDALLRGFPEVESVIGKAGRADTPTDPAPLDMVETFVNFRPKECWPKRVLKYPDALEQTLRVQTALEDGGYIGRAKTTATCRRREFDFCTAAARSHSARARSALARTSAHDQLGTLRPWRRDFHLVRVARSCQGGRQRWIGQRRSQSRAETMALAAATTNEQLGKPFDLAEYKAFKSLQEELQQSFAKSVFLWPRTGGRSGDLIDDEMSGRVLQTPGWGNVFTQPIINRIDMLSTGVRTDIGVKVFGGRSAHDSPRM